MFNAPLPCNCRRSSCLKLYCECFKGSFLCGPACRCTDCKNTIEHMPTREYGVAVAKRGKKTPPSKCMCRKGCLKKYCLCFKNTQPCSDTCGCDRANCLNTNDTAPQTPVAELRPPTDPPARPRKIRRLRQIPTHIRTLFTEDPLADDDMDSLDFPHDLFGPSPAIADHERSLLQKFADIDEDPLADEHQPTPHRLSFSCTL